MKDMQGIALNGAIFGTLIGVAYHVGKAWQAGQLDSAWNIELFYAAAIGAAAGALAFVVRRLAP